MLTFLRALFSLEVALNGAALSLLAGKLRHRAAKLQSVGMLKSNPKPDSAERRFKPRIKGLHGSQRQPGQAVRRSGFECEGSGRGIWSFSVTLGSEEE